MQWQQLPVVQNGNFSMSHGTMNFREDSSPWSYWVLKTSAVNLTIGPENPDNEKLHCLCTFAF